MYLNILTCCHESVILRNINFLECCLALLTKAVGKTHTHLYTHRRMFVGLFIFLFELLASIGQTPSCECVFWRTLCHGRTTSPREAESVRLTHTHTHTHTSSKLLSLVSVSWLPWSPSCSDPSLPSVCISRLSSSAHSSSLLSCLRSCASFFWVNHVLFGGFRKVSGSGPAASGPLLHPGQPAAALSNGRNHLYPAGTPGQVHLVLRWTWRWRTAGEDYNQDF